MKYIAIGLLILSLSGLGLYIYNHFFNKSRIDSPIHTEATVVKNEEVWKNFKISTKKNSWYIGEFGSFMVSVPVPGNYIVTFSTKNNSVNKSVVYENKEIFLEEPFKKSGNTVFDVILTKRENGVNSGPKQVIFNVVESEKQAPASFTISRIGKTFIIDNYEALKKNIKSVNWNGSGQKQSEAGFKYDNASDVPKYITINLKYGKVERIKMPK